MKSGASQLTVTFLVSMLAFLSSCSSVYIKPPGPEAQTILILPFTTRNTSGSPYGYYYRYEIVKDGDNDIRHEASFKLPNASKFLVIDTLSPGTYIVKKITRHPVESIASDYDVISDTRHDLIKLDYGKITIFRNSINITQKPFKDGLWVNNYRISSVGVKQRTEILEKLKKLENFSQWEVSNTHLMARESPTQVPDNGVIAHFPEMSVGDSWVTNEYHRDYGEAIWNYKVIAVETDGTFDMKIENNKSKFEYFEHFDSKAPGVPMLMGIRFDPQALHFPLFIGKSWETEVEAESTDGSHSVYKNKYVVEEYTKVETGAGNLEAFRIKADLINTDTNWEGHSDYWYAPSAKAIVKSTPSWIRGVNLIEIRLIE